MTYTKLFSSIIYSTIWREENYVRILWVTMLALTNFEGCVEASIPGLADAAKITIDECEKALKILMSPDPYSRTKDNEGRRIKEINGGWLILNHSKYRNEGKSRAEYYRKWRSQQKQQAQQVAQQVCNKNRCERNENHCAQPHTDTDTVIINNNNTKSPCSILIEKELSEMEDV